MKERKRNELWVLFVFHWEVGKFCKGEKLSQIQWAVAQLAPPPFALGVLFTLFFSVSDVFLLFYFLRNQMGF